MLQLFRAWIDVCLLRKAPQDLPASAIFLVVSFCCYTLVSILVSVQSYSLSSALLLALTDLTLLVVFTGSLLLMQGKSARIMQTLSAMAGSGSVLGICALPLFLLTETGTSTDPIPVPAPLAAMWLLLLLWNLLVVSHIIRHALSSSFLIGFGLSLLYAMLSMQVIGSLFS